MPLFHETADVSVRPAVPGDEADLARIQLDAWRHAHLDVLGGAALDLLDESAVTEQWAEAINRSPGAGYHVLVACAGPSVVGFASVAPVRAPEDRPFDPPGGIVPALEVAPAHQRAGHGSRLLAAAVDLLREDGADQVQTWVLQDDTAREHFLDAAGLAADGATRTLASTPLPDGTVKDVVEHRWSASI